MKNQKGFAHLGLLIVLLLVGAIAGFSYWRISQSDDKPTSNEQASSQTDQQSPAPTETVEPVDPTASWYEYQTSNYSMRIPDGWNLRKKEGGDDSLYSVDQLVSKAGVKAQVNEFQDSKLREFSLKFYLDYSNGSSAVTCKDYYPENEVSSFDTKQGVKVYGIDKAGTNPVDQAVLGELSVGETGLYYCLESGNERISIGHTRFNSETSVKADLETAIKSIKF